MFVDNDLNENTAYTIRERQGSSNTGFLLFKFIMLQI
jgi:hypothetical protein